MDSEDRPPSERPQAAREVRLRTGLVLPMLAVTVFVMAWGTLTVVDTSPQAMNLALAMWAVLVVLVVVRGVSLDSVSDGSWFGELSRSLTNWATGTWSHLMLAAAVLAVVCVLVWLGMFAAVFQVRVSGDAIEGDPDCKVGWLLVRVSCATEDIRIWSPFRRVALYHEGEVTDCRRNRFTFSCALPEQSGTEGAQPDAARAPRAAAANSPLLVYFQMSKSMEYEKVIRDGFRRTLDAELGSRFEIDFVEGTGTRESYWSDRDAWRDIVDEILVRHPATDYVVTVGSDATTALIDNRLPERLSEVAGSKFKGLLMLGVTDPMRAGFALQDSATDIPGRAVVRYGSGANDWVGTILHALDDTRLPHKPVFIHSTEQLQDSWVASELADSPLNGKRIDIIGPIEGKLALSHLDQERIFFAWYALDSLVDSYSSKLLHYRIIPSTFTEANVRNFGLVVSPLDVEIGERGARYLAESVTEGKPFERLPTQGPPFHIWVNCSAIERKNIPLSPRLKPSEVIFVPDAGQSEARTDCVKGPVIANRR